MSSAVKYCNLRNFLKLVTVWTLQEISKMKNS